jgi:hypothetical protein
MDTDVLPEMEDQETVPPRPCPRAYLWPHKPVEVEAHVPGDMCKHIDVDRFWIWKPEIYKDCWRTHVFLDDFILENGQIMNMNIFIANLLELL